MKQSTRCKYSKNLTTTLLVSADSFFTTSVSTHGCQQLRLVVLAGGITNHDNITLTCARSKHFFLDPGASPTKASPVEPN